MQIHLNKLRVYARHGVWPQETAVGAPFTVSLTLVVDDDTCADALLHDRLEGTVDYARVYEVVRREMAEPSQLIERVAHRLATAVLREFVVVREVGVEVAKLSPPIAGFDGDGVSVSLTMRRRLYVFDFDGTLADTRAGIVATMQATFAHHGLPLPPQARIVPTIGLPLTASIGLLLRGQGMAESEADVMAGQLTESYRRLFEEVGVERVTLFDGVAGWLQRLHSEGCLLAIATSRGHLSTDQLCRRLGIRSLIGDIVACDDVTHAKPHPEAVLRLMQRYGCEASDTIVVGDTTFDIEMGRSAGCRTVGVTWGNHTAEQLNRAAATSLMTPAMLARQ